MLEHVYNGIIMIYNGKSRNPMSHEIPMCAGLISMHLARHIADFDEPKLDLLEEVLRIWIYVGGQGWY